MMPPFLGFGGYGRVLPLDPPVAVRKVSKLLHAKWFHDTVYCIPVNDINRKLENVWKTFRDRPGSASGVRRHYRANYSVVKCHLAPTDSVGWMLC